ncbi:alcohol dehydrogenase family protein [Vibrio hippocampi]|uniref:Crotonyl-CoA carboxylase/reductase n=1 Tax=Vibrio hippocampi TaxID=654686 RepID=A0ABM8ZPG3_9VIBR|nr:alcohol dehydrogenase family protein [Vibrio hippocampi]CAH0530312.1 Crotonyl-CoA carboxylase/reductase [Vibrio hippocampi]
MMFTVPENMKGVQLVGHGGPEQLVYRDDLKVPVPLKGEVLIKVAAAGVNNTDINTRTAWYSKSDNGSDDASWSGNALVFPRIQGADVCGYIVAVGEGVDSNRIGERVIIEPCLQEGNGEALAQAWYFGSECDGGFAEYTKVAAKHAYRIETALSDVELASFPCSYSTAENMLTRADVQRGETVLVTGASGGVGSAAVQLAKARGATVIAVTSESKRELLMQLGADQVINRGDNLIEALGHNHVDVVVDLVAGNQWPELLDVMKPFGRYAVAGAIGGAMVNLDVRSLYLKDLSLLGCTVLLPQVFANLVTRIEQGKIKPLVAQSFALKDIALAQHAFGDKQHVGKLVLRVDAE